MVFSPRQMSPRVGRKGKERNMDEYLLRAADGNVRHQQLFNLRQRRSVAVKGMINSTRQPRHGMNNDYFFEGHEQ